MKTILSILLFVLWGMNGFGQKPTWDMAGGVADKFDTTTSINDSIWCLENCNTDSAAYIFQWSDAHPPYDTVECVMIICDTSIVLEKDEWSGKLIKTANPFIGWVKGYVVKECYIAINIQTGITTKADCNHISYLDENKKPLPKNIIVWLSK